MNTSLATPTATKPTKAGPRILTIVLVIAAGMFASIGGSTVMPVRADAQPGNPHVRLYGKAVCGTDPVSSVTWFASNGERGDATLGLDGPRSYSIQMNGAQGLYGTSVTVVFTCDDGLRYGFRTQIRRWTFLGTSKGLGNVCWERGGPFCGAL